MSGDDRVDMADVPGMGFWLVMLAIIAFLTLLIGGCVVCTIRCFTSENTLGPQWELNRNGERYVRPFGVESWRQGWLGRAGDYEVKDANGAVLRDGAAPRLGPIDGPDARTPGFREERAPSALERA